MLSRRCATSRLGGATNCHGIRRRNTQTRALNIWPWGSKSAAAATAVATPPVEEAAAAVSAAGGELVAAAATQTTKLSDSLIHTLPPVDALEVVASAPPVVQVASFANEHWYNTQVSDAIPAICRVLVSATARLSRLASHVAVSAHRPISEPGARWGEACGASSWQRTAWDHDISMPRLSDVVRCKSPVLSLLC